MTITKAQKLQLIGLKALAAKHLETLDDLDKAALDITKENPDQGWTSDLLYNGAEIDYVLDMLGIEVEA